MERLWSRLGMEKCCLEAGRVLDDGFVSIWDSTHPKIH